MKLWVFYLSIFLLVLGTVMLASATPWPQSAIYVLCIVSAWFSGYQWGSWATVRHIRSRFLVLDKDEHEKVFMGGLRVGAEEALIAVEAHGADDADAAAARVREVVRRDMSAFDDHYDKWTRVRDSIAPNATNAWEKA